MKLKFYFFIITITDLDFLILFHNIFEKVVSSHLSHLALCLSPLWRIFIRQTRDFIDAQKFHWRTYCNLIFIFPPQNRKKKKNKLQNIINIQIARLYMRYAMLSFKCGSVCGCKKMFIWLKAHWLQTCHTFLYHPCSLHFTYTLAHRYITS